MITFNSGRSFLLFSLPLSSSLHFVPSTSDSFPLPRFGKLPSSSSSSGPELLSTISSLPRYQWTTAFPQIISNHTAATGRYPINVFAWRPVLQAWINISWEGLPLDSGFWTTVASLGKVAQVMDCTLHHWENAWSPTKVATALNQLDTLHTLSYTLIHPISLLVVKTSRLSPEQRLNEGAPKIERIWDRKRRRSTLTCGLDKDLLHYWFSVNHL